METRFANLLVEYCLDLQPGQTVLIEAEPAALPLLEALQEGVLQRGAYAVVQLFPAAVSRPFFLYGGEWLNQPPLPQMRLMEHVDASLRIESAQNPLELAEVPPARLAQFRNGWRPYQQARARKRWCLTLYPTPGYAQQAGMSTAGFRAFVERALYLDRPDPVAAWRELSAFQAALIERLQRVKEIRLQAEGTDLRLRVEGRTWINSDGRRNMPSGEVFTGPLEASAEGEVRFNLPVVVSGQRVAGVRLRFREGQVVEARAEVGEEYLHKMLEADPGARYLGELGIGTNYGINRSTGLILYDEKIGGTVHLALGQSYPETGGKNTSSIHWDLILDLRPGGRVLADGQVLQENGQFVGL
ncbi:MAG: aminopeptidase [Meiothermus sp.]|uniref:aminopeptidase n=1 Tax=Meiothermus sp. TaxID=1955249 RepID=UPI0025F1CB58|nr:aminopeptidase [Meiothermus sp.]MCS7069662.1 aminopeptidase [Meiothermus sp.]MCX7601165.1 aminopeptidase [Meiothermus sp.]MDW8426905.1 aminopeptidase [Meiothermus sp.]